MRLIDADALKEKVYSNLGVVDVDDIDDAPTVDAVAVVRCKDCVHYFDNGCGNTNYDSPAKMLLAVKPDWYCADGERLDDDNV